MQRKPIVWCEGLIASGKSKITEQLSEALRFKHFTEPVADKGYLELFYQDPKRWAFSFQIEMLRRRWDIHRLAMLECKVGNCNGVIMDRGAPGDKVFGFLHYKSGNIHRLEWETYENLYSEFMSVPHLQPTMLLFLDVTPETALRRIRLRGRPSEELITLRYLEDLREAYNKLLDEIESGQHEWSKGLQVLKINWSEDNQPITPIVEQIAKMTQMQEPTRMNLTFAPTQESMVA